MNQCQIFDMQKFRQERLIQKVTKDFEMATGPSLIGNTDTVCMHRKLSELINGLGQIISSYESKLKISVNPTAKK